MKKVLITGFLPFAQYKHNPTQDMANYLHGTTLCDAEVIGVVLPCTYHEPFETLSLIIDKEKPDVIINTGLSSSAKGVRFETRFQNIMNGKYPDTNGYSPKNLPIVADGQSDIEIDLRNDIFLRLRDEYIPIEVSTDSEGFICNSLGYLVAKKIQDESLKIKHFFMHVPWTDDYKKMVKISDDKIFLKRSDFYKTIELLVRHAE